MRFSAPLDTQRENPNCKYLEHLKKPIYVSRGHLQNIKKICQNVDTPTCWWCDS